MTDERYPDDDPSNVRQIGERRGDPIYSQSDYPTTEPANPVDWDDTPHTVNELPQGSQPPPPRPLLSTGSTRRQEIIDEAAQLANTALEVWRQAIDVMGIVDLDAREKHSRLTKGIASAVEEWEGKL